MADVFDPWEENQFVRPTETMVEGGKSEVH